MVNPINCTDDNPRSIFNRLVQTFGLRVCITSTDGWVFSCERPDGLRMWRIVNYRHGTGVQTAWLVKGRLVGHRPYYGEYIDALKLANARSDLPPAGHTVEHGAERP